MIGMDEAEAKLPRKRGRPRKARPETAEPIAPAETAPIGSEIGAGFAPDFASDFGGSQSGRKARMETGKPEFAFVLEKKEGTVALELVDRKGKAAFPDFRRMAGAARDAVREYAAQLAMESDIVRWDRFRDDIDSAQGASRRLENPDPRLLDLAARAEMLIDRDGIRIVPMTGECSLLVSVSAIGDGVFSACLSLSAQDAQDARDGALSAPPVPVSPRHVLAGSVLYRVADLGPEWKDDFRAATGMREAELPLFLSLAFSRLNGLGLDFPPHATVVAAPRTARPALVFSAIDAYGYLHIRPVSALPGYPPGFLEDSAITRVVEVDELEKEVRISDILFPSIAGDEFRALLSRQGKGAKTEVFEEAGIFILSPEFAEKFLADSMGDLMAGFLLYQADRLSKFKVRAAKPRLKLSLVSGIDFLEGRALVELAGEQFSYPQFLREYRKQSFITLSDGSRAYPERGEVERFERMLRKVRGDDELVQISFFDYPLVREMSGAMPEGEIWKRPEDFYRGYNSLVAGRAGDSADVPPSSPAAEYPVEHGTLRDYQGYGARWMEYLRSHGLGACLADEMGLGKTVQTIALLRGIYRKGELRPSLLVMPKSLLFNWMAELARFAPELTAKLHYGADREADSLGDARLILTSYAVLRRDFELFASMEFCTVILDESQMIKNSGTKTTQAVLGLKSHFRLALSGTPVENSLGDLYSLFSFLNPGMFGTQSDFMARYMRPIQESQDESALRDLKTRIYPFILRRLKRDVLKELPAKSEQVSWIELEESHLARYHQRRAELKVALERSMSGEGLAKSRFLILQAFTELRRLASVPEAEWDSGTPSAKREFLKERIQETSQNGHKCLVFTNYLATVDLVSRDLADLGIGNLVMTGATSDRQALVRQFQTDPEIKAFIMTLKTGGLGLNLTAAEYVFIFDPWWNSSAESQAIDRTHRIGQKNPVFCYRLIAKDTIEEKILALQEKKTGLVSSLISSDTEAFKSLDEADIEYLLG
jgi:superfamily II DNA or RNA helicase